MFKWLKALFSVPRPAGPQKILRTFSVGEPTFSQGSLRIEGDGWCIVTAGPQTVRLFEVKDPGVEQCLLAYRAQLKTENFRGRAFLEMWCRLPGRGEFFSKGFHQSVSGTTEWSSYEIPFSLKKGERPDLIKLNLVAEGTGTIWLRKPELLQTPLA